MQRIQASVGLGGHNRPADVAVVQTLLTRAGSNPGPVDRRCGRRTLEAIERFQRNFMRRPDGRVDVNGPTLRRLNTSQIPSGAVPGPAAKVIKPQQTVRTPRIAPANPAPSPQISPSRDAGYWTIRTPLKAPDLLNRGLTCPTAAQMQALLGNPNDKRVKDQMLTASVGPMRVTGHPQALASLREIYAKVKRDLRDLYDAITSWGMYNVRTIRDRNVYSNHSWGTAVDLIIGGLKIQLGETRSCKGVDALVKYFHEAGWYWGGGYRKRKDCMHFECSLQMVQGFKR